MRSIQVNLPGGSYSIQIEPALLTRLGRVALDVAPSKRALLAVDSKIVSTHGRAAQGSLEVKGCHVIVHPIVADESRKTLETVRDMYQAMLASKCERGNPVIALGGGVVGDIAGFAAATYMRGVPVIQVPTTLLAMVDAAIGGKTGVNFPVPDDRQSQLVKNIIGSFWQPAAVVIDPETLKTLDARDFRCGLAECVKHALIADVDLLTFIADHAGPIAELEMDSLVELIERSTKIKVGIVQEDEREAGKRALLNLGHTFAHAIEPIPELDLRHGEAVSIGLAAALHCALATGRIDNASHQLVLDLFELLELPTRLPHSVPALRLIEAMSYDKKVEGGRTRLVLPVGVGKAEVVVNVPRSAIIEAWMAVGASDVGAGDDELERTKSGHVQ